MASSAFQEKALEYVSDRHGRQHTNAPRAVLNTTCFVLTTLSLSSRMKRLTETCGRIQKIRAAHEVSQAAEISSREADIVLADCQQASEVGKKAALEWISAGTSIF